MFKSKQNVLTGSSYDEVYPRARAIYDVIEKSSKRRTYVRSLYFKKQKVFLDIFWSHIHQKKGADRTRRLKFYGCAIDLIRHSVDKPESRFEVGSSSIQLHRFIGNSADGACFCVQIKENQGTKKLNLLSVFPWQVS